MTDRDRLIKLLCKAPLGFKTFENQYYKSTISKIADYLIANGVTLLPCKVGDTVYYITGMGHNLVKPAKVKEIILDENGIKDLYVQGNGHNFENSFDIFFLTREEAEKKLKEWEDD